MVHSDVPEAASRSEHPIGHVDLTGDRYRVEQTLFRNKYTVYDADDREVLKGKQALFKLKESFPFETPDGQPVFEVKAENVFDFAGDYVLLEAESQAPIAVLEKEFTLFHHAWRIKDPDGTTLAHVESRSTLLDVLRGLIGLLTLLPYKYAIETPDGRPIGEIEEHFSLRDKYDVRIHDAGDIPKETIVAAAIVIDALEGN